MTTPKLPRVFMCRLRGFGGPDDEKRFGVEWPNGTKELMCIITGQPRAPGEKTLANHLTDIHYLDQEPAMPSEPICIGPGGNNYGQDRVTLTPAELEQLTAEAAEFLRTHPDDTQPSPSNTEPTVTISGTPPEGQACGEVSESDREIAASVVKALVWSAEEGLSRIQKESPLAFVLGKIIVITPEESEKTESAIAKMIAVHLAPERAKAADDRRERIRLGENYRRAEADNIAASQDRDSLSAELANITHDRNRLSGENDGLRAEVERVSKENAAHGYGTDGEDLLYCRGNHHSTADCRIERFVPVESRDHVEAENRQLKAELADIRQACRELFALVEPLTSARCERTDLNTRL